MALLGFVILFFIRRNSRVSLQPLPPLSAARVIVFAACHVLLLAVAFQYGANLGWKAANYSSVGTLFAALKLLVLVPTIVLFPFERAFVRSIASELTASLIVLFTFNPDRYFRMIWPTYSYLLGAAVTLVSAPFVPGLSYARAVDGVVVAGPVIDLHVEFSCSGVNGVGLFQLVFAMIVAVEWNRLAKVRALMCYAGGLLVYLLTNFLRLLIANLTGNLWSPRMVDPNAAAFFTLSFIAIVLICCKWMAANHDLTADQVPM